MKTKKKNFWNNGIFIGLIAFTSGMVMMAIITFLSMPNLMLIEDQSPYEFDQAVDVLVKTIELNGWKTVVVHDLQETMQKYGKDVARAKVIEVCHPEHAYKILRENDERIVSALMPCRIAIYEKDDGKVYVSRMNSGLMGKMMKGVVPEVMGKASKETEEIIKSII